MDPGKVSAAVFRRSVDKRLYHLPADAICSSDRFAGSYANGACRLTVSSASDAGCAAQIGGAAVYQAAARLAASGTQPLFVTIQTDISPGVDEKGLHLIAEDAAAACRQLGIPVLQSDVFVTASAGDRDCERAFAVVTATAVGESDSIFSPVKAEAGQDLIMAGYAGWRGSVRLAALYADSLRERFNDEFTEPLRRAAASGHDGSAGGTKAAAGAAMARIAAGAGVRSMHAAGEGGIFTAVWDMAQSQKLGVRIRLDSILLRQETVEVCDHIGVNPYLLMSQGVLLMASEHSRMVLEEFAAAGIPAAVIGYFTDDNDRVVITDDETRFLEPFRKDSIYDAGRADML